MFAQLAIYLILSLWLHHVSRLFQFINASLEDERAFILKLHNILKKFPLITTYI
jgi:hypothetical protein